MPNELDGKIVDKEGSKKSLGSIKKMLAKLVDLGMVKHYGDIGYQSMEYVKLEPNFAKGAKQ